jgi:hypothetical protein
MSAFLEQWGAFLVFALLDFGLAFTSNALAAFTRRTGVSVQANASPLGAKALNRFDSRRALKRCSTQKLGGRHG